MVNDEANFPNPRVFSPKRHLNYDSGKDAESSIDLPTLSLDSEGGSLSHAVTALCMPLTMPGLKLESARAGSLLMLPCG